MKVTAGIYKGLKIKEVKKSNTRPTQDKVRQAIFNMLFKIEGKVLDLFAGTGSLGIEALSRGANKVYFVDRNIDAYRTILKNVDKLDQNNIKVIKKDYEIFLKENKILFNYIFIDPPYNFNKYDDLINKLYNHLEKESFLILELLKDNKINFDENKYELYKNKIYGNKQVVIIKKKA